MEEATHTHAHTETFDSDAQRRLTITHAQRLLRDTHRHLERHGAPKHNTHMQSHKCISKLEHKHTRSTRAPAHQRILKTQPETTFTNVHVSIERAHKQNPKTRDLMD